jgi:ketosteroid isomerase-like protein
MSQENVELVRAAWEAWERRDMEAIFAFYDPEIVWDQTHYGEPSGVYHGHDGIRQFLREWFASFESYYVHAEEFTDAGPGWFYGCGRHSGAQVREPYTYVMKWLDGQIVEWREYHTKPDALKAVGLKE